MVVSHALILHLHHVTVIRNLSHHLNLGGYFLREFNTQLCFDMQPPCLWIGGEYISLRGVPATPEAAELEMGYDGLSRDPCQTPHGLSRMTPIGWTTTSMLGKAPTC